MPFTLASTDTINLDGTVTRLLCPECRTPMDRRGGQSLNPGYVCPDAVAQIFGEHKFAHAEGTPHSPRGVTWHPLVVRVEIPLER